MKQVNLNLFFIVVVSVLFYVNYTPKAPIGYERTGLVTCNAYDDQTITVTSSAIGATVGEAIVNSERQAFENLLFKGVPNCNQNRGLIPDENDARNANPGFFKELLIDGGLRKYTTTSETTSNLMLQGNAGVGIDQKIQIDLNALRRNLEREGVIRKFGL